MGRISFFQDIMYNLFEPGVIAGSRQKTACNIRELCHALLSERGEVSGTKIAASILAGYASLGADGKLDFFQYLLNDFDVDPAAIGKHATMYSEDRSPAILSALTKSAEPVRRELLRRLNQAPAGTEKLVRIREDLLSLLKLHPELASVDADFQHLFSSWFNRGFLVLHPIDWQSPASILEKIIDYEAVHAIDDWDQLRLRLQPEDRRCFAFFHPAMPQEPLIFVEIALTSGIPRSIGDLLSTSREPASHVDTDTAVFYSISNCQKGLRGISFGNFLIKQVANDLAHEFPHLKNFVTLSPIPGFARWIHTIIRSRETPLPREVVELLDSKGGNIPENHEVLEPTLLTLLAQYFLNEKTKDGYPIDPVARFHLGNGAVLQQMNWMADQSKNGISQSFGMMVNYKYDLRKTENNHEIYVREKYISTTRLIRNLAKQSLGAGGYRE